MSTPQHPLDPCKCWGVTKVTLTVTHCPSLNNVVREELDKVIRFVEDQTRLKKLRKVKFQDLEEAR